MLAVIPAAIMGFVFAALSRRIPPAVQGQASMVDLRELWQRWTTRTGFALVGTISIYNMAVMAVLAMATLYLVQDLALSTTWAGLVFAAMIMAGALLQPLMGHFSDVRGRRKVFAWSLMAAAPLGLAMPFVTHPAVAIVFLVAMVGASMACVRCCLPQRSILPVNQRVPRWASPSLSWMASAASAPCWVAWPCDFDLAYAFVLASVFAVISATIALMSTFAFPNLKVERAAE